MSAPCGCFFSGDLLDSLRVFAKKGLGVAPGLSLFGRLYSSKPHWRSYGLVLLAFGDLSQAERLESFRKPRTSEI